MKLKVIIPLILTLAASIDNAQACPSGGTGGSSWKVYMSPVGVSGSRPVTCGIIVEPSGQVRAWQSGCQDYWGNWTGYVTGGEMYVNDRCRVFGYFIDELGAAVELSNAFMDPRSGGTVHGIGELMGFPLMIHAVRRAY